MCQNSSLEKSTYFTESHEWVCVENLCLTVGLTLKAIQELSDVVYIQLPCVGDIILKDEPVCILESTKAAIDLYAPASGKVIAQNENLIANPSKISSLDEEFHWLYKVQMQSPQEIEGLLTQKQYEERFLIKK